MLKLKNAPPALVEAQGLVEKALYEYANSKSSTINEGITSLLQAGGKRVRALLCLIGMGYGCEDEAGAYNIEVATMPEMLHLASLIHDDIIDQADSRRGVQTMHKRYGSDVAVYAGDFIIVDTLNRMYGHFLPSDCQLYSKDLLYLVNGEIAQMAGRYQYKTSVKDYLRIIEGKTARLLKMSFSMGLSYAKVDQKTCKPLLSAVHDLGMAFQIIDDCLDYAGDESRVGKPLLSDLKNGYLTLPAILRKSKDANFASRLEVGKGKTLKLLKADVKAFDPYTRQALALARRYSNRGLKTIKKLENQSPNPMHGVLSELIVTLLERHI